MKRPVSIVIMLSLGAFLFFSLLSSGMGQLLTLGLTLGIFFGTINLKKTPEPEQTRPSHV